VDAGGDATLGEVPAQAQVADVARRTLRLDAARTARKPRVEHDAVADVNTFGLGSD